MNINRHNYEEFFLLYIDNELEADGRSSVEKFLQENPDLSGELKMLQQVVLSAEPLQFDDKEHLYKKEKGISLANYEEYFLLSVDNELSEKENDEVEKFVLKHPNLQGDFTILQQTKLEPEHIRFAHREDLYRQETNRRVIPIVWARMSIAAAILGLAVAIWMVNNPSNTQNGLVNITKPAKLPAQKPNVTDLKVPVTQQVTEQVDKEVAVIAKDEREAPQIKSVAQPAPQKELNKENNVAANILPKVKENDVKFVPKTSVVREKVFAATPKPEETPAVAANKKNNIPTPNVVDEITEPAAFANYANVKDEPAVATHTVYREIDTDEEEKSIYIGAAKINKNKLKGLFKKASGLLEKKFGKNSDDKLL